MPSCRGKHLNGSRLGTVDDGRQVADHTSGLSGQSQLDRSVQLLHDVTEAAGNLKNNDLTYLVLGDPACRLTDRTAR
jgi:hypothetical protein